jgi:hypothetical protein
MRFSFLSCFSVAQIFSLSDTSSTWKKRTHHKKLISSPRSYSFSKCHRCYISINRHEKQRFAVLKTVTFGSFTTTLTRYGHKCYSRGEPTTSLHLVQSGPHLDCGEYCRCREREREREDDVTSRHERPKAAGKMAPARCLSRRPRKANPRWRDACI